MKDNYDLKKLKKKKRINSRTKGNTFERKVAKILNERFDSKMFARTPGSGAFATTHTLPEHLQIHGDLITPPEFKFCVECKKGYNSLAIHSLLDYNSEFWKFIAQVEEESKRANKYPLLILQQDRKPILGITTSELFKEIENYIEFKKYRLYYFNEMLALEDNKWLTEVLEG